MTGPVCAASVDSDQTLEYVMIRGRAHGYSKPCRDGNAMWRNVEGESDERCGCWMNWPKRA